MKHIKEYTIFLEEANPNTPNGYLNSLSKKPILNKKIIKPTEVVDNVLLKTKEQEDTIIKQKDVIEKGLLNNVRDLNPENQKEVKKQVKDYGDQLKQFKKTTAEIDILSKTLKKSNIIRNSKSEISNSRLKTNF